MSINIIKILNNRLIIDDFYVIELLFRSKCFDNLNEMNSMKTNDSNIPITTCHVDVSKSHMNK